MRMLNILITISLLTSTPSLAGPITNAAPRSQNNGLGLTDASLDPNNAELMAAGGGGGGDQAVEEVKVTCYISYGALRRNTVPCSRRGASYYNCRPSAQANPYTRGCNAITMCRTAAELKTMLDCPQKEGVVKVTDASGQEVVVQ